jgi:hypothetical protein
VLGHELESLLGALRSNTNETAGEPRMLTGSHGPSVTIMTVRLASVLVLALLVASFAGCGGDKRRGESEATEATTRPSAAQSPESAAPHSTEPVRVTKVTDPARRAYVARVDSICAQIDPERAKEQERVGSAADPAQAARTYGDTIALGWRELRRIEAIPAPAGEKAVLKANVFEPIKGQLALRDQIRGALAAANVPLVRRLRAELDNSTRALTGFARGYGFQTCGEE